MTVGRPVLAIARPEDIGPALRDLRNSQDVRLIDVADALGIQHITHLSAWENDRTRPRVGSLVELLSVYDYQMMFMHRDAVVQTLKRR